MTTSFVALRADSPDVEGKPEDLDLGAPGAGARREHERRKSRREAKTREDHPHLGGLFLRLQDEPQRERALRDGAIGEEAVASHLAKTGPGVVVLHDRRMPKSRANIDHIAIAPSGVFVIDAKRYKGKIEVRKPLFGGAKLVIRGRDKTKLVDGLKRQVEAVRAGLAVVEQDVPVGGCFRFINPDGQAGGSGIPLFRTLSIGGLPLFYPRKLSKHLHRPGPLNEERIEVLTEVLIELFPSA
ncbi:MAG TPA: nuclease-related domain-containing protein [Solirubrobacterales bacterium]|nr:nuclease-related domain-containing protein [Solirubrobacterales bacterium]